MISQFDYDELITVIVLTYNNCRFLEDTLISIEKQAECRKEVIICDDGSTDEILFNIYEIVSKFKNTETFNCRVHASNVNRGTVRNINSGIAEAHGICIKIIAADDIYPSERIFIQQMIRMNEAKKEVIVSKYSNCNEKMEPSSDMRTELSNSFLNKMKSYLYADGERIIRRYNLFPVATQACLFHRDFFSDGAFCEDYRLIEDVELSKRIRQNPRIYDVLDIVSVNHRCNVGVSSKNNIKKRKSSTSKVYLNDCRKIKSSEFMNAKGVIARLSIRSDIRYIDYLMSKNEHGFSIFRAPVYGIAIVICHVKSLMIRARQILLYWHLRGENDEGSR